MSVPATSVARLLSCAARRAVATVALLAATAALVLTAGTGSASASASATLGSRAVAQARLHHGQPYSWGASGPRRFDCSGLVQYVYRRLGRSLPHNAAAQYRATSHLRRSQLRPGDLVFTVRRGGIRHVGIYAGGNRMWAATQTGDVVRTQSLSGRVLRFGRVR